MMISFNFKIFFSMLIIATTAKHTTFAYSSVQTFISRNQENYNKVMDYFLTEILKYQEDYRKSTENHLFGTDLIVAEIYKTQDKINSLAAFSNKNKDCVDREGGILRDLGLVRTSVASCTATLKRAINFHINEGNQQLGELQNYVTRNVTNFLNICDQRFAQRSFNYISCVLTAVQAASDYTNDSKNRFVRKMEQSRWETEGFLKRANECSFRTVYNAGKATGEVLASIEQCVNVREQEKCAPCPILPDPVPVPAAPSTLPLAPPTNLAQLSNSTAGSLGIDCRNVINMILRPALFRDATISNPFYGLDRDTECVVFNFRRPFLSTTAAPA